MVEKKERTEHPQTVPVSYESELESFDTPKELEGFYEYSASLRTLWHWIELLKDDPTSKTYFHKWLMEEIEIGNGFIYCPGTIPLGPIAPEFPNATTPSERALAIAITQAQFYLVGLNECAVDNVDRLCLSLPYLEDYKHKIRLAVGVAKSRWSILPEGVWSIPVLELATRFLDAWLPVAELLQVLFYVVDTEIHTTRELATPKTAIGSRTPPPGYSEYMSKYDVSKRLKKSFAQLKRDSSSGKGPRIIEADWNRQKACYQLEFEPIR
jgi:hypothetical protein